MTSFTRHEGMQLEMSFESHSIDNIVSEISSLENPQVFLWYIGIYGLKENGVQFYNHELLSPVINASENPIFWLVDLTAWGALKTAKINTQRVNSCANTINQFNHPQIKCISASTIFHKMKDIKDEVLVRYFQSALKREFIWDASKEKPDANIKLGAIFRECPILTDWYNCDAAKCYSMLQYLEACLLIEEAIVPNQYKEVINIVFVLPSDELKYYQNNENTLQKDVLFFLQSQHPDFVHKKISVKFLAFEYGANKSHRPYNSPGRSLRANKLTLKDIISIHPELQVSEGCI